jgi:hypothetical protein
LAPSNCRRITPTDQPHPCFCALSLSGQDDGAPELYRGVGRFDRHFLGPDRRAFEVPGSVAVLVAGSSVFLASVSVKLPLGWTCLAVFRRRRRTGHGFARRAEPVDQPVGGDRGDQGLEGDLGVRTVRAAPARAVDHHKGHQFYRHATRFSPTSRTRGELRRATRKAPEPGTLSSGSPRWSPATCCRTCSRATAAPAPRSNVSAIEDNGDYLEHLLIGGELDVAVMVISNLRDRVALQAEIFETSPYRLWLPIGHRSRAPTSSM